MTERKTPEGFVPLTSLSGRTNTPAQALAMIRQIYFRTSPHTLDHDFAHALELLKSLPDEETRARAHVYMEGLAEMSKEWARGKSGRSGTSGRSGRSGKGESRRKLKKPDR